MQPQTSVPGRVHQSLLWLFRHDRLLAVELAHRVAGRPAPLDVIVLDRSNVLQRPGLHNDDNIVELDLLLTVHRRTRDNSAGAVIRHVWVVEVQLGRDPSRAQAWTDYLAASAREFGIAPVHIDMLVVCPDASVRKWINTQVLSKMRSQAPLILRPRHVQRIDRTELAQRRPEAAVLGAVFHAHEPAAVELARTAHHAILQLEPRTRHRYRYLIQTFVRGEIDMPTEADLARQPHIEPPPDEIPYDSERRGLTWAQHGARYSARGRAEGFREGMLQARREALLRMFTLLGLLPTAQERALVETCEDLPRLESWIQQLPDVSSLAELLQGTAPEPGQ